MRISTPLPSIEFLTKPRGLAVLAFNGARLTDNMAEHATERASTALDPIVHLFNVTVVVRRSVPVFG